MLRIDSAHQPWPELARWPERLSREAFYLVAYPVMLLSRRLEERLLELFQKGYVKGTVTSSMGNEATTMAALPLRSGRDVVSLLHRDFGAHLLLGATPYQLICQYMANAESPTHGCEGNVHHGDAARRRFPMISHLGKMLSLVVGGTWAARRAGEEVFGLAVIGDGGTSTGEFHEALNLASVRRVARAVPRSRTTIMRFPRPPAPSIVAGGFPTGRSATGSPAGRSTAPIPGKSMRPSTNALDAMREEPAPAILECMTLRLHGHAAYDKGLYVPESLMEQWRAADPLPRARRKLREVCGLSEAEVASIDAAVEAEVHDALAKAMAVAGRSRPASWHVYAGNGRSQRATHGDGDRAAATAMRRVAGATVSSPAGRAVSGPGREERRRRPPGLGIHLGPRSGRVLGRTGHRRLRLGVQDVQGADRPLRAGAGDRHAAGRVGHGRVRPGGVADRRAADRRIPVRRFLHRGGHADWA